MWRLVQIFAVVVVLSGGSDQATGPSDFNTGRDGLLIRGYDPVAYFAMGEAVKGTSGISHRHDGLLFHFATEAHRDEFETDPEAYIPAFGGYCAYGVALGEHLDSDPEAWRIIDGRLHLFLDHGTRGVWMLDEAQNKAEAERLWPNMQARTPVPE